MTSGYGTPLYLLAFDHRSSFERGLFGATPPLSSEVRDGIVRAKQIVFEANQLAVRSGAPRDQAGVLVDEEFGSAVARRALEAGVPLAMPVERSGQEEFDFQYGANFAEHIEAFDPTFVKVLVRFNPEGDPELNRRQTERWARLSEWLRNRDFTFLFELLVPATTAQLDSFEGHQQDYDRHLRPRLVEETVALLQTGGVEPDIWKIEGLDSKADASAVVRQAAREEGAAWYASCSDAVRTGTALCIGWRSVRASPGSRASPWDELCGMTHWSITSRAGPRAPRRHKSSPIATEGSSTRTTRPQSDRPSLPRDLAALPADAARPRRHPVTRDNVLIQRAITRHLAQRYKLSADEIGTLGDLPNDVLQLSR